MTQKSASRSPWASLVLSRFIPQAATPTLCLAVAAIAFGASPPPPAQIPAQDRYADLPLSFEPNYGQSRADVQYLARAAGFTLFLTPHEAAMTLNRAAPSGGRPESYAVVRLQLTGSRQDAVAVEGSRQPGVSNYLAGADRGHWLTNVPTFDRLTYREVYEGIDITYYGQHRQLEYDFIVQPGADPNQIQLAYQGADRIWLRPNGELVLSVQGRQIVQHKPVAYQQIDGRRMAVSANVKLTGQQVRFALGHYDRRYPLVIDPVLAYSNYLVLSGDDVARSIAVDASGSAYVTGFTESTNFPVLNALQGTYAGGDYDAFVMKLSPAGTSIVYSTFLGGSGDDLANSIKVDATGNAYVAGRTNSTDFPTLHPFQAANAGGNDVFLAKLSPAGNTLVFSTYLGGSANEGNPAIAVDGNGSVFLTAQTGSANFPTTAGAFQRVFTDGGFVAKFSPAGDSLLYSTFLNGAGPGAIAVDSAGSAYITGTTTSKNLPTVNAFQSTLNTTTIGQTTFGQDAFVTKLSPTGGSLIYSTYLGGGDFDNGNAIAVDSAGNAYVTGQTSSDDFPLRNAYQNMNLLGPTQGDAFLTKISPAGNTLVYSTFLGGGGASGSGVAVNSSGEAYVTGFTISTRFPTVGSFPNAANGSAFLTKFAASGTSLAYSVLLGNGTSSANPTAIALDNAGGAYIAGITLPITAPGTITFANADLFVLKVTDQEAASTLVTSTSVPAYNTFSPFTLAPGTTTVQTRTVTLASTVGATSYASLVAGVNGSPIFLSASPANGTLPATITLSANPTGLTAGGPYTNTITFSAGNSSTVYTVTIFVEPTTGNSGTAKAGIYRSGLLLVDLNGDGSCCDGDLNSNIGQAGDIPLLGRWVSGGRKQIGLYRPSTGLFLLDVNGNGAYDAGVDKALVLTPQAGDVPVVGDWTGTGVDRVGVFRNGAWLLDVNGDGTFSGRANLGQAGDIPLVGNWNGVGSQSKVGIYRPLAQNGQPGNFFLVDSNGDGQYIGGVDPPAFFLGQQGDVPIVGDWSGDGKTKLGIFRPFGSTAGNPGLFILDQNGNYGYDGPATDKVLFFAPYLTGPGTSTSILPGDLPLTGNWVPSYTPAAAGYSVGQGQTRTGIFRPSTGTFFVDATADGTYQGRAFLGGQAADIPVGIPMLSGGTVLGVSLLDGY